MPDRWMIRIPWRTAQRAGSKLNTSASVYDEFQFLWESLSLWDSINLCPRHSLTGRKSRNKSSAINGILVQLPLPKHVDKHTILEAVPPKKDVDGFHSVNVGSLVLGHETLVACTPSGVMEILHRSGVTVEGANAVVLGRSDD